MAQLMLRKYKYRGNGIMLMEGMCRARCRVGPTTALWRPPLTLHLRLIGFSAEDVT